MSTQYISFILHTYYIVIYTILFIIQIFFIPFFFILHKEKTYACLFGCYMYILLHISTTLLHCITHTHMHTHMCAHKHTPNYYFDNNISFHSIHYDSPASFSFYNTNIKYFNYYKEDPATKLEFTNITHHVTAI